MVSTLKRLRVHTPLLRLRIAAHAVLVVVLGCACASGASAGVLPDDRADVLWHHYSGGGISIDGPSVLIRKKVGDHVSVAVNHYEDNITGHVDTVSGASVDAVSGASTYREKRTQNSLSVDLLHDKTTYSGGFINSVEPDYKARTAFASISQDMFGDLTTVSFGFTRGWDRVGARGTTQSNPADRRNWQVGITQILTRNLLAGLNYETSESEGTLNNPYRKVRFVDRNAASGRGFGFENERYPHTRTGNAASIQTKYFLPWRAAVTVSYRYYRDTWGIKARTGELGLTQPVVRDWLADVHVRLYRQSRASFYSDLFGFAGAQNFLARDRELASFKSTTLGIGLAREIHLGLWPRLQKITLNGRFDRMRINYSDYRNLSALGFTPGTEPLFTLNANVWQAFISAWF